MSKKPLINSFRLFQSIPDATCEKLMNEKEIEVVNLKSGDIIPNGSIYCVIKGSIKVLSKDAESDHVVRYLSDGDVFGVASVFAKDPNLSKVQVENKSTLIRVSKETVMNLMKEETAFLSDYLEFLSDRIAFLNTKISYVSSGSSSNRLSRWIYNRTVASDSVTISMSDLAKLLSLGRASLYRAIEELEECEAIKKEGNTIRILNREILKSRF